MAEPTQSLPEEPIVETIEQDESASSFINKAMAAGLSPEEINSELKARYNIDLLQPVQEVGQAVSRVFRGGAPEGMRPKTVAEEIMEPIATTSGIVAGALGGLGDIFRPYATQVMIPGSVGKTIAQQQKQKVYEEIQEIRKDIDKEFAERYGAPVMENLRKDLTENVEGVLEIINVVRGAEDFTADHKSTVEHLFGKQTEGSVTGRQFSMGFAADIGALGDDPELYFRSRPFTSAMMLAGPLAEVNALAKAGYGPAIEFVRKPAARKLQQLSDSVSAKMSQTETGVKVKQAAQKTNRAVKEGLDSVQRWVSDPFVQQTEKASKLTEALVDTAARTGKSVTQIANRWAEAVKRGYEKIDPASSDGVRIPVERAEQAVGRRRAHERWDTPDTVKVFSQEIDYNPTTAHFGGLREAAAVYADAFEAYKNGLLTKQQYESFVKTVRQQETKPVDITIANTHWRESAGRFLDELSKLQHVDPNAVMNTLNQNLSRQTVGMLRSKNIQKLVTERIVELVRENTGLTPEQIINLKQKLPRYLDEINKRDPSSPSYQANAVINFDGYRVNLGQEVLNVIDNNPKLRNNIYSELLAEAAGDIAKDTRLNVISDALKDNMPMFSTSAEWIDNAIQSVIVAGEDVMPLIQGNPHQLATRIIDNLDGYAKIVARSEDPALLTQARKQLRDLAHKIRSYQRMPTEMAKEFGLQDYIAQNKKVVPPRGPEGTVPKLEYEVFAPKGVLDTLKWEMAANTAVNQASGFWNTLNRQMKANLTARNLASALNNIKANFVYQTFRRGSPLLASNLTDMMRKWHGFRTGKDLGGKGAFKLSPEDRNFFLAMERSGLLDTDILDAEIGVVTKEKIPAIGKVAKYTTRQLEKLYKAGDNIFKLEESLHNYKKIRNALDKLNDGEYVSFEVGRNKKAKLVKQGDSFYLDNKRLSASQLDDVLVRGASLPAERVFFDYTRVPNAVKFVRASKALGITSPFFTWFWKAIDIPIIGKRGLLREALNDGMSYSTNSKALNAERLTKMGASIAKRQAMLAGIREAVKAPENSEVIRKALGYSPKEMNIQLLDYATNPTWIEHDSEESANQFGPSDIFIRAVMSGYALSEDEQSMVEILYPEEHGRFGKQIDYDLSSIQDPEIRRDILIRRQLLKKHASNEALTPADVAQLIGVSGSPMLDGMILLQRASQQGPRVNRAQLTKLITGALIGGTAAAALDVAVAGLSDPNSPSRLFTTRQWAENEIGEPQEKFLKWAMRRVTGIGFRPMDVKQRTDRYWANKEKEWKDSMTGQLEGLLKENVDLSDQDRTNIQMRINEINKIIEGEIMLEKLHAEEVWQNLRKNVKKK
jgi:hypothetical protein